VGNEERNVVTVLDSERQHLWTFMRVKHGHRPVSQDWIS
jgi:hypothetical protein